MCRNGVKNVSTEQELQVVIIRDRKGNKKGFCENISAERKTKENGDMLIDGKKGLW